MISLSNVFVCSPLLQSSRSGVPGQVALRGQTTKQWLDKTTRFGASVSSMPTGQGQDRAGASSSVIATTIALSVEEAEAKIGEILAKLQNSMPLVQDDQDFPFNKFCSFPVLANGQQYDFKFYNHRNQNHIPSQKDWSLESNTKVTIRVQAKTTCIRHRPVYTEQALPMLKVQFTPVASRLEFQIGQWNEASGQYEIYQGYFRTPKQAEGTQNQITDFRNNLLQEYQRLRLQQFPSQ